MGLVLNSVFLVAVLILMVFYISGLDYISVYKILFSDSYGNVQKDIYNKKGNPSYKYYYGSPPGSK